MKYVAVLVTIAALSACASESERGGYSTGASAGASRAANQSEQTFNCPNSFGDCTRMAREYCGEAGYTRVRAPGHTVGGMGTAAGPSVGRTRSPNEIRRRTEIAGGDDGTLTVRCK